jgi:predicted small lipoprotein YifL
MLFVGLSACGKKTELPSPPAPVNATVGGGNDSGPKKQAPGAQEEQRRTVERVQKIPDKLLAPAPQVDVASKPHFKMKAAPANGTSGKATPLSVEQKKANLANYSVTVAANQQLEIPGNPGELRVWIGYSANAPITQPGMATQTKPLEAVGETARVTPFTLGIDVEPKQSECEKIDPSGSEVRFKLIPTKVGSFTVGANVELYGSKDCSGPPVPKSAKSVEVTVRVNEVGAVTEGIVELADAAWKAFFTFWDRVLLLIFSLCLFLIRKKLAKWFGFKGKE